MFPNNEIDDLNDDGFEGSTDESRIFAEVFLGIDLDRTSSWGFPSESINECKFFKQTDNSLFSNSNNSAIPSHVGSCYAIEDLRENSAHCCSSEGDHLFLRNDHDMNDKRMRLPADELSYSGHHSVGLFHSPAPFKRVVSDISRAAAQGVSHSVTCHVVESSRQGVTSSCHLLEWLAEKNLGGEIGDWNVAKLQPQDVGNYAKEVDASKTICSPMSQDSSASKLLVASPFSSALNNSGSCQSAEKTIMLFKDHKMSTKTAISRDSMNNPRQFLRNHVQDLLRAAGWGIGRRKRQNNIRGEFLYYSPWGDRPIRELRRVWHLCGRSFFPNAKTVRQGGNKQWADMTHLLSDLSNTIFKIEKELSNKETATVLAQQWYLLDPFVTMAFIDKKLDALRAGKSVKARRTLVINTSEEDAVLALDYVDVTGKQLEEQSRDCDFSLVKKSALTVSDSIYDSCSEKCQSGSSAYIGKLPEQRVKDLEGLSVHLPEYERTQSTYSVHKTGTWCGEFSKNKRTRRSESFLQARGPDSTYDYFDSCLFEVPITFEDANAICGRFETVSPCYDHNKELESCNRHRSDNDDVIDLEVKDNNFLVSCEEGKTFNGQLVEIVENQLKESLNNHLSCRSGDIAQSNDQNRAHVALYTHVENVSEPCKPSLLENSHLVDIDIKIMQHPAHIEQVDEQSMGVSECKSYCSSPFLDATFKRRAPKKLERTTNGKPTLCQNSRIPIPYYEWEQRDIRMESMPIKHSGVGDSYRRGTKQSSFRKFATGKSKKSCHFPSEELFFENTTDEAPLVANDESLHLERWMQDGKTEKPHSQNERMRRSSMCHLKDKDLLISAIVKNKTFSSSGKRYGCKRKSFNSQARRKHKIQKGSCRLLPRSLSKGGNHIEGQLSVLNIRTVLSWLIDLGVISLGEVAQYRSPKYDTVVKDGIVTRDGIFCKCCNKLLSVTEFKIHAGFRLNHPCLDLFMESGKSFALCQLEAWSAEYKARKSATRPVDVEGMDQNDDRCGLCGDGGELICCDNCPSTFHQECLEQQVCLLLARALGPDYFLHSFTLLQCYC